MKNKHKEELGSNIERSDDRIDKTGEVFTPLELCDRMIDEIPACYGLELGLLSRIGLLKLLLYNLLYAGVSELAIDLGLQSIGADLAGKFSARAAQGLGAGLLSARLGIKAMQVCRPVAFSEPEHPPRLSQIAKGLRKTLLKQIVPTGKKQAELE